jgi:predicted RNase H-like nuclease
VVRNVTKVGRHGLYIGFDSAWTDNSEAPGAICTVGIETGHARRFHAPQLALFDEALTFIRRVRPDDGVTLIALDQPTVVPNLTGMRPVERVAASLISSLGGGVQPSNRGKLGMFCDASPIWRFLTALGAEERAEQARLATNWPLFDGGLSGARAAVLKHRIFRITEGAQIQSGS